MKTITSLIITAVLTLTIISCQKKGDDVETMMSGFMTAYTDSEGYIAVLVDDMGNRYMVSDKNGVHEPDTLLRIVASIALDENNTARILQKVFPFSHKAPEDASIHDSSRVRDPFEIESIYIGGGFLNMKANIKVQNELTTHYMAYSRLNTPGPLRFTIYHDARGDVPVYTKHVYISIPLSGYGLSKKDTVFLSYKGYEEDHELQLIYR